MEKVRLPAEPGSARREPHIRLLCPKREGGGTRGNHGFTRDLRRGVDERVVERVQGALAGDRDLEGLAGALVDDGNLQLVGDRVPEQANFDSTVLAGGELDQI